MRSILFLNNGKSSLLICLSFCRFVTPSVELEPAEEEDDEDDVLQPLSHVLSTEVYLIIPFRPKKKKKRKKKKSESTLFRFLFFF